MLKIRVRFPYLKKTVSSEKRDSWSGQGSQILTIFLRGDFLECFGKRMCVSLLSVYLSNYLSAHLPISLSVKQIFQNLRNIISKDLQRD